MSTTRKLARNLFSLTLASAIMKLIGLAVVIYTARVLGAEAYGQWNFAITVAAYFGVFVNLGVGPVGARELAQRPERLPELLSQIIPLKFLSSLVGLVLAAVVAWVIPKPVEVKWLIFLCYLPLAMAFWHMDWVFTGVERLHWLAVGQVVEQLVAAVAIFILVHESAHVARLPLSALVGTTVGCGVMWWMLWRHYRPLRFRPDLSESRRWLRASLPVAAAWILGQLNFSFDTVMLSFLRTDAEVGWYNAAYRLLAPLFLMRFTLMYSFLPVFSRLYAEDPTQLRPLATQTFRLVFLVAVPLGVGAWAAGQGVVDLVYGPGYEAAGPALWILAWAAVLMLPKVIATALLYGAGRQQTVMYITAGGVGVNILLNLWAIPRWGIQGAALTTVFCDVCALGGLWWLARGMMPSAAGALLVRPVGCAAVMGALLWWLSPVPVWVMIPAGMFIYVLALWACGGIQRRDVEFWRRWRAGGPAN